MSINVGVDKCHLLVGATVPKLSVCCNVDFANPVPTLQPSEHLGSGGHLREAGMSFWAQDTMF